MTHRPAFSSISAIFHAAAAHTSISNCFMAIPLRLVSLYCFHDSADPTTISATVRKSAKLLDADVSRASGDICV